MDQILTSCVGKIEILSRNSRAASRQNSNNSNSSQPAKPTASKPLSSGPKPPPRPKSLLTNGIQNGLRSLSPSFPIFFQDFFGIDHYKTGLNNDDKTLRVLLVGERNVGKSSFCSQYAKKVEYPDTDSSSRAFDGYHGEIVFKHTEARTSDSSQRTSLPGSQFSAMSIGHGNNHRRNSQNHNQNSKFNAQSLNNSNFSNQDSNKNYLQNTTQNSSHQSVIDRWKIQLITMPPEDEYERYRRILYSKADVCVICFSVIDSGSFNCAIRKWLPELKGAGITKSKTIMLGMHKDERPEKGTNREEKLMDRIVDTGVSAKYASTQGFHYDEVNNHWKV